MSAFDLIEMQKEKRMTRQELMNECDMLKGNINRMMVTDSREELCEMYYWASTRLATILREQKVRIANEGNI